MSKKLCYETMPIVVAHEDASIRDHLWTLYWLVRHASQFHNPNGLLVDIGVARGDSTRAILAGRNDGNKKPLISVDYEIDCWRAIREKTDSMGLELPDDDSWTNITADSIDALNFILPHACVDFLFLDTSHEYPQTLNELEAWHPRLAHPCIVAGHDYGLPDVPRDGVKPSVQEFLQNHPGEFRLEAHENCCGLFILWRE